MTLRLGKGDGAGSSEVSVLRMPSVVSRVRRYGEVKKCRVSSGLRRLRRRRPASWACVQPSGVSLTRWSGMFWWMSRFSEKLVVGL